MKKIDLTQAITIVANVGVIVGLAFLAVELNQANRIARYTAENARRSQHIEINSSRIEYSDTYAKLQAGDVDLTPPEQAQALMMARQLFNTWLDAESAYNNDLLSETTFELTLVDISVSLREAPGLLPYFAYLFDAYGHDAGVDLVSRRIAEELRAAGVK